MKTIRADKACKKFMRARAYLLFRAKNPHIKAIDTWIYINELQMAGYLHAAILTN